MLCPAAETNNKQKKPKNLPPPHSSFSQTTCNSFLLPKFVLRNPLLATRVPRRAHCHDLPWERRGGRAVTVQHPQYRDGGKTGGNWGEGSKTVDRWTKHLERLLSCCHSFQGLETSDRKNSMERKDVLSHPFTKSFPSL